MVRAAVARLVEKEIVLELVEDRLDEKAASEHGLVFRSEVRRAHVGAFVGDQTDALFGKRISQSVY